MKKFKLLSNLAQLSVVKKIALATGSIFFIFIFLLLLIPSPFYKDGFRTLQELQTYAKSTNELEPMSNNNTLKPEFETYYQKFNVSFFKKIKAKLSYLLVGMKIIKKPVWSASFFKTLLTTQAKEREGKGLTGNVICKITTTEKSKFVVFGNLQGAFHSFVRYLEKLKELGIINDKLEVIQPDHYVIFMGNIINRSCYSMETLAAVARFVQVNPDKVIYLRGNHETNNYWQEHTLKRELQIRAAQLSSSNIPLEEEVNKYFNTLPHAAYITIPDAPTDFIRISHLGRGQSDLLNENNYTQFLTETAPQPLSFTTIKDKGNNEDPDTPISIKVIIRGEKKRDTFQSMEGLRLLAPDMDSVAWNILSCPTFVFQKAIKFYHDAFVILSADKNIDEWRLTLYSRDTRSKNPFKATTYFLLSGINTETKQQLEQEKPSKKDKKKKIKSRSLPERSLPESAQQTGVTQQIPVPVQPTAKAQVAQTQTPVVQQVSTPQPTQPPVVAQQTPAPQPAAQPQTLQKISSEKNTTTNETLEKINATLSNIQETLDHLHRSAHRHKTKVKATIPEPDQPETEEQAAPILPTTQEKDKESAQMTINQIGGGITEPKIIPSTSGSSMSGTPEAS